MFACANFKFSFSTRAARGAGRRLEDGSSGSSRSSSAAAPREDSNTLAPEEEMDEVRGTTC